MGASSVPACTTPYNKPCIPGGISSIPFNSHIVFHWAGERGAACGIG